MTLAAGTRLGPYEILAAVGAGGMGEVYRATDTNLKRAVAIKVLPASVSGDPERLARFQREAEVLASLNHPNIAAIYGLEKSDGTTALVMELVEGEDLSQQIARGPIPLDEALPIAKQIAEALEAAHEQGIIHRDLKPANIKVRPDGTIKVLDFGLAKLAESPSAVATGPSPLSLSPTITSPAMMTGVGVLLGTAAYMSPEQAKGREADKRSDIWAFGCVLYEMLTGRHVFDGEEVADVLARVLERQPDFGALPPRTPHAIERLVRRALEKDRKRRLDSAAAARLDIEEAMSAAANLPPAARTRLRSNPTFAWGAAAILLVIVAGAGAASYFRRAPDTVEPVRFFISPPDGWEVARASPGPSGASAASLAVSPDGRALAFVARNITDGRFQLWVRSLATLDARPLDGTQGSASPFWSPDSQALGFFSGGKLKKVPVAGGPPVTLADAPTERGGAWSRDGVIIFAPTTSSPLMRVPADGGTAVALTKLGEGDTAHQRPVFLSDGRHFLYRIVGAASPQAQPRFYVASLDSPQGTPLLTSGSLNIASAGGRLLFLRETTLIAQGLANDSLTPAGEVVFVAEQIQTQGNPAAGTFSASDRVLAYQAGTSGRETTLTWFDRSGKPLGVLGPPGRYTDVELSSDDMHATVSMPDASGRANDIWMFDVARNLRTRFTFDPADELVAVLSPDGTRVAFNSRRKGHLDLYVKSASGAGAEELLLEDQYDKYPTQWSPDGRHLLYVRAGGVTSNDLYLLPLSADRRPIPFAVTPSSETPGCFSPDGRWIAYTSNESGRTEIYVAPVSGQGGKWQISVEGGLFARWTGNGSEIVYLAPDNTLMVAEVNGKGPGFAVGVVKPLFRPPISTTRFEYAVSRDGQRFLINTLPQSTVASPITVVLNWAAGVKK